MVPLATSAIAPDTCKIKFSVQSKLNLYIYIYNDTYISYLRAPYDRHHSLTRWFSLKVLLASVSGLL
jgi:hypothetical protein